MLPASEHCVLTNGPSLSPSGGEGAPATAGAGEGVVQRFKVRSFAWENSHHVPGGRWIPKARALQLYAYAGLVFLVGLTLLPRPGLAQSSSADSARLETPGPSNRRTPMVISEIMYRPAARADSNDLEYVELYN